MRLKPLLYRMPPLIQICLPLPHRELTHKVAPLEAIGLFGFAWTSLGPDAHVHWIAPMIFSVLVGIANVSGSTVSASTRKRANELIQQYAIYMSTIDYMVAAYGPYAASGECITKHLNLLLRS
jgi:hypothetical protein